MWCVGFTASRNISGVPASVFTEHLDELNDQQTFITGACRGGDTAIGLYLSKKFPKAYHTVIVPGNLSQVDRWWEKHPPKNLTVQEMPFESSYKDRNQEIVDNSNTVIGFPEYSEHHPRSLRSGTWQTIRMARKANKLSTVVILRGE